MPTIWKKYIAPIFFQMFISEIQSTYNLVLWIVISFMQELEPLEETL